MGQPPEGLLGPELPDVVAHLWQWFGELNAGRGSGGMGPNPIGYADIEAWARLTGARPAVREVGWLIQLDHAYLAVAYAPKKESA